MGRKLKLEITVAVNDKGEWSCAGGTGWEKNDIDEAVFGDVPDARRVYVIKATAEVPDEPEPLLADSVERTQ